MRERRAINLPLEVRQVGGKTLIAGYAAVFYDRADPGTEFVHPASGIRERIARGAFDEYLQQPPEGRGVAGLFNHDRNRVLGRWPGTLQLRTDQRGLWYEVTPPDTETGREVTELLARGDIPGSSFSFTPGRVTLAIDNGQRVRQIDSFQAIYDVGPVIEPAYQATTSLIAARAEWLAEDTAAGWEVAERLAEIDNFRAARYDRPKR